MIDRVLEYWVPGAACPTPVRVVIGSPLPTPEGDYQSTLSIEGLGPPYAAPFRQVDALGAVLAAAALATVILKARVQQGGRLTWLDGSDLGFPLLTPPKHSWTFRPATGGEPQYVSITVAPAVQIAGRWSCLVTLATPDEWNEHWIQGDTWAHALERGAAAVPRLLGEFVEKAGDGVLEDRPSPQ